MQMTLIIRIWFHFFWLFVCREGDQSARIGWPQGQEGVQGVARGHHVVAAPLQPAGWRHRRRRRRSSTLIKTEINLKHLELTCL